MKMKIKFYLFFILILVLNISCSKFPDNYILPKNSDTSAVTSPSGTIIINSDEFYTLNTAVTLTSSVANADEMQFSNDGTTWSGWEPYTSVKAWTLSGGNGLKTVYSQYRKTSGGSSSLSDNIVFLNEEPITALDGVANAYFGGGHWNFTTENLTMSQDGKILFIGAPLDQGNKGAVYVYRRNGNLWNGTKISPPDAGNIFFGNSISVTSDGNFLAIGALNKPAVYLYRWNGSLWNYEERIDSPTGITNDFAVTVSLSSDGNKLLVGSWQDNNQGAAYLYSRNGGIWDDANPNKFTAFDGVINNNYGFGAAISGEGNLIIIGDPFASNGGNAFQGAIYIYRFDGSSWIPEKRFTSDGAAMDYTGRHISITSDGKKFIVSTRLWNYGNGNQGAAYIYDWNGIAWVESRLTPSDTIAGDRFGYCVSISSDGNSVAISAPGIQGGNQGKAYVYRWNGTLWNEYKLNRSNQILDDFFGNTISISGDGTIIGVGAPLDNSNQGAVYVY